MPAVPWEERVVLAPTHAPVEEETASNEVVAVDFNRRLGIQDMYVGCFYGLVACLLQRLLEGASPEFVVAERRHHGEFSGNRLPKKAFRLLTNGGGTVSPVTTATSGFVSSTKSLMLCRNGVKRLWWMTSKMSAIRRCRSERQRIFILFCLLSQSRLAFVQSDGKSLSAPAMGATIDSTRSNYVQS
ncbi:MAG: hypothetical protein IKR81_04250 [Victivallales bacterium]|nr:hypothetical protein [Victivallales bacterium]